MSSECLCVIVSVDDRRLTVSSECLCVIVSVDESGV